MSERIAVLRFSKIHGSTDSRSDRWTLLDLIRSVRRTVGSFLSLESLARSHNRHAERLAQLLYYSLLWKYSDNLRYIVVIVRRDRDAWNILQSSTFLFAANINWKNVILAAKVTPISPAVSDSAFTCTWSWLSCIVICHLTILQTRRVTSCAILCPTERSIDSSLVKLRLF